jgi:uroporphyrinogen III methyltransferase/synthase
MGNLAAIVDQLRRNGLDGATPVAIVREATLPTQETLVATLDTVVAEVERTRFAAPAVVVIGDVVRERDAVRWFDTGPLFGKRVLITRPSALVDAFASQLWEAGAEPIAAPTIAVGPPDDPAAAARAVATIRDYGWVAFTSQNGVAAFFDALGEAGKDARAFGDARVAAIGPKTASALAARGIRVDFVPTVYVNEAVAEGMLARTRPNERILVFRAQEARDVLPQALRAAGRVVDVVAGYRTRFVDDPELRSKVERADVVTFTSSSTVQGFVYNLADAPQLLNRKFVATIGPITAKTALGLGIRVDAIPDEYTIEGLLGVLGAVTA